MKNLKLLFVIAIAASVIVACKDDETEDRSPNEADIQFIQDVSLNNVAEVQLGEIASTRGVNALVRSFADQMIREHSMAQDELESVVNSVQQRYNTSIVLPAQLDQKNQMLMQQLYTNSGYHLVVIILIRSICARKLMHISWR